MSQAEQPDKANQTRAKWFFCALSKVTYMLHTANTKLTEHHSVPLKSPLPRAL